MVPSRGKASCSQGSSLHATFPELNELEAIAGRIRRWATDGPQGPFTLELYPTLRCNLNCAFCDTTDRHRPATNELSVDRQLEILEEAAALGAQRVFLLGGGEPLLSAATPKLMERTKELGLEGVLTTNGTRFSGTPRTTDSSFVHISDRKAVPPHPTARVDGARERIAVGVSSL